MPTRAMRRQPSASRKSRRRTTSSAIRQSESSTTRCAGSARSTAEGFGGFGGGARSARGAGARGRRNAEHQLPGLRHRRAGRARRSLQLDVRRWRDASDHASARTGEGTDRRSDARHSIPHRRPRRKGADRARGERRVQHLSRLRRCSRRPAQDLPGVQRPRRDLIRSGRISR